MNRHIINFHPTFHIAADINVNAHLLRQSTLFVSISFLMLLLSHAAHAQPQIYDNGGAVFPQTTTNIGAAPTQPQIYDNGGAVFPQTTTNIDATPTQPQISDNGGIKSKPTHSKAKWARRIYK